MFGEFYKSDITGKANDEKEQQIDTVEILKSIEEENGKRVAEITMDTLFKTGITYEFLKERGFTLPDGYHFTDEHGNTIEAAKILIKKNSPTYPKTYEECCGVLGYEPDEDKISCYKGHLIEDFVILLICRDAYWKIAGEELGLDKPWKPDWKKHDKKYIINVFEDTVIYFENETYDSNTILAFPTEEMRNIFYENFKNLIEICKELL